MHANSVSIELHAPSMTDVPAMKALWSGVFGDEDEYIDAFFAKWFRPEMAVCGYMGDTVEAMGFLMDYGTLRTVAGDRSCAMIYGVAVSPQHRSCGIGGRIVRRLMSCARENGYGTTVLHPAHKGLYPFYEALGHKVAFTADHYAVSADRARSAEGCTAAAVEPSQYGFLRGRFAEMPCIDISDRALAWYDETGGRFFVLMRGNAEIGCAAAEMHGDMLLVKELLCRESEIESGVCALFGETGAKLAIVSVPSSDGEPFGTADVPMDGSGWLGLAFD